MFNRQKIRALINLLFCKQAICHFIRHKKFYIWEKKKLSRGELYNAGLDLNLYLERQYCKKLCYEHNNLSPEEIGKRCNLITKILGKTGKTFLIEQPFMCDYGYNIEIGEEFCSNHNLLILDCAGVKFGDNVLVGPNCSFYTTRHPVGVKKRSEGLESALAITVGDNVWIGGNVVVLPGVKIGNNSIIGAGSIVKDNIPSNVVAAGVPCRVIRTIEF